MSLKKTDLALRMGQKIEGQMKHRGIPQRFAQASTQLATRERPAKEATSSLVPISCKLPAPLVQQLRDAALQHPGKLNGLMAELLERALPTASVAAPQPATAKTDTPAKKAAAQAPVQASAQSAPVKKATAKKASAKAAPKAVPQAAAKSATKSSPKSATAKPVVKAAAQTKSKATPQATAKKPAARRSPKPDQDTSATGPGSCTCRPCRPASLARYKA